MKTKPLLALLACILSYVSFSQPVCGFDVVHQDKLQKDPNFRKIVDENEKKLQQFIAKNRNHLSAKTDGVNSVLYTIPVVVHVMHTGGSVGSIYNPSDAQIQGAITYLNQVYNGTYPGTQGIGDMQLQFALAARDPNCNPTSGINRIDASSVSGYAVDGISTDPGTTPGVNEESIKDLVRWNPAYYYNIWIVNKIDGKDGTSGTFTAGYAYFPGAPPVLDGTIMLATQMTSGRSTLPHEIGHAFGLYHTFQGSDNSTTCPANTNCNSQGDFVCDTDPVSLNLVNGVYNFSCRTGTNTCTGTSYSSNTESNYMSYTSCTTLFTAGQKARLLAYAGSAYRKSLSTSFGLQVPYPITFSSPVAALCTPATSAAGLSGNYAGIINIELNNRNLGSSSASFDNGYVDGTGSCMNVVQLVAGSTYSFTAALLGANQEQVKAWIDYNNDGVFDDATELIHTNSSVATGVSSGNFIIPSSVTQNTMLRMRVMDDISTIYGVPPISGQCSNLAYGQAEDYSVYITSGTLPVTLVRFDAALNNGAAFLTWKMGSVQNLKSFDVEKSTDGISFSKIGTLSAGLPGGTSNSFAYTDGQLAENNYYRLRIYEKNGASQLSQVVAVRQSNQKQQVTVLTNPFQTSLDFGLRKPASQVRLQLLNATGALVAQKLVSSPQLQIRWQLPTNLSRGSYFVKLLVDGELFVQKVMKP